VLYSRNPGWDPEDSGIGICYAELQTGMSSGAAKVFPSVIYEILAELVTFGGRETRKGCFDAGDAFEWSQFDFERRKIEMEHIVRDVLRAMSNPSLSKDDPVYVHVAKMTYYFWCMPYQQQ
jgi:hypothetical protein